VNATFHNMIIGEFMELNRSASLDDLMMDYNPRRMSPPPIIKRQISLTMCTEHESCQCGRCKQKKFAAQKYEPKLSFAYSIPRTSPVMDNWTTAHSQDQSIQIVDSSHGN
jgi:hypothetical protein